MLDPPKIEDFMRWLNYRFPVEYSLKERIGAVSAYTFMQTWMDETSNTERYTQKYIPKKN